VPNAIVSILGVRPKGGTDRAQLPSCATIRLLRALKGGTIFLDEVGELPAETQTLSCVACFGEHEFEHVGGTRSIQTDVRVIAATNRDSAAAVAEGTFRSDLFYRLNVFRWRCVLCGNDVGQVFGSAGAAGRLGMPGSTLESKIRSLH